MGAGQVRLWQLRDRPRCRSLLKMFPQAQMALLAQRSLQVGGRGFVVTDWVLAGLEVLAVSSAGVHAITLVQV